LLVGGFVGVINFLHVGRSVGEDERLCVGALVGADELLFVVEGVEGKFLFVEGGWYPTFTSRLERKPPPHAQQVL